MRSPASLVGCLVLLTAALAGAKPSGTSASAAANEHVAAANRAFQAGDYRKAFEELRIAHQLAPRAEFLLSFAQIYRAEGRLQEALEACHAYLTMVPNGPLTPKTHELIEILQAEIARTKPSAPREPEPPPP